MVAITIGMLLLAGLGTVYLGSRQTYRQQDAMARMQEGARYAFELMTLDVRQAGYTGCAPIAQTFSTLNGTDWFNNLATQPLAGYESGAGLPAAVTGELAATDALSVLRADDGGDYRVAIHNGPAASFQLVANHDLSEGEILTVVPPDCSVAVTFQMSGPASAPGTVDVVVHNTGVGTPGNSTKCLADPASAPCSSPATYPNLPPDSTIMRLSGHIYYLANNATSAEPSLFRERLSAAGGVASSTAEELVEGVENMQIVYGEDTSPIVPGTPRTVDQYVAANAVANWTNVLAVRVSLLMRSVENNVVNQPQEVAFNGGTVNTGVGADRRLRKVFTATIAVRNRL